MPDPESRMAPRSAGATSKIRVRISDCRASRSRIECTTRLIFKSALRFRAKREVAGNARAEPVGQQDQERSEDDDEQQPGLAEQLAEEDVGRREHVQEALQERRGVPHECRSTRRVNTSSKAGCCVAVDSTR